MICPDPVAHERLPRLDFWFNVIQFALRGREAEVERLKEENARLREEVLRRTDRGQL